jgi:hypothetical protein
MGKPRRGDKPCACGCGERVRSTHKETQYKVGHSKRSDPVERFWRFVRKSEGCWEWIGAKHVFGYGKFTVKHRASGERIQFDAHRYSWILANGSIAPGKMVLHRCNNPPCVRIDHLYLGTHSDNVKDAWHFGTYDKRKPNERDALGRFAKTVTSKETSHVRTS